MEERTTELVAGSVVRITGGATGIYETTKCLIGDLAMYNGAKFFLLRDIVRLKCQERSLNLVGGNQVGWYYDFKDVEYVGTLEELGLTKEDFR